MKNASTRRAARRRKARVFVTRAGKWVFLGAVAGVISGAAALLFHWGLHHASELVMHTWAGFEAPTAAAEGHMGGSLARLSPWLLVALPTLGGLLAGVIVFSIAPEAEGHGTDAMIHGFHRQKGRIRPRIILVKAFCSLITICTGGSAGREGPVAQVGGGIGSWVASVFKLSSRDRRLMLLAGAAGGIGAVFRAPLGGAIFASEVLYREANLEGDGLVPNIVSSIVAYSLFTAVMGHGTMFGDLPDWTFVAPAELIGYTALGLACAVVGRFYIASFYGMQRAFRRLAMPSHLKPAVGGLLLGLLALGLTRMDAFGSSNILAGGYGLIQQALDGRLALGVMAALVLFKILATCFTISSGGSGGVFAPSLVIGAMLGGVVGLGAHEVMPGVVAESSIGAFVLAGMGGFYSGVAKVPLTAVIMASEISGSYGLLVPLMVVAVLSFILMRGTTIMKEQVDTPAESPAHAGEFVVDVLQRCTVRQVVDFERPVCTFLRNDPLRRVLEVVPEAPGRYYPVLNEQEGIVGIFGLSDIRRLYQQSVVGDLVTVQDFMTEEVISVAPDDDLHTALRRFTIRNIDELPVVDPEDETVLLGMLSRKDVIAAYDDQIALLRPDDEDS